MTALVPPVSPRSRAMRMHLHLHFPQLRRPWPAGNSLAATHQRILVCRLHPRHKNIKMHIHCVLFCTEHLSFVSLAHHTLSYSHTPASHAASPSAYFPAQFLSSHSLCTSPCMLAALSEPLSVQLSFPSPLMQDSCAVAAANTYENWTGPIYRAY